MRTAARPAFRRIIEIELAIRDGSYPNSESLGAEMEVDARTIQRDIAFMRDQLRAPLKFCRKHNGYFYTDLTWSLPAFQLTEGELVSVFLAENLLRQYRGTPFENDLTRAFERIVRMLPDEVTVNLPSISDTLSVTPCVVTTQDVETFQTLTTAIRQTKSVNLVYWSASQNKETQRLVDPYHVSLIDSDWYLIAYCHTRQEIRMFSTLRIRKASPTTKLFSRPESFDINEYLGHSFRAVRGNSNESWDVVLKFHAKMAGRIKEKIWHHSQQLEPQTDGSLIMKLHVSSLIEIRRWVMFWGSDCKVIEPQELRESLHDQIRKLVDAY